MNELLNTRYWAIESTLAERMAPVVEHRLRQGKEPFAVPLQPAREAYWDMPDPNSREYLSAIGIKTIEAKSGLVAVLKINGAMSRYGEMCSKGTEDLMGSLDFVNQHPLVSAIVLSVDSPGGQVNGTKALADAVRTSEKPVVAWVAGMAASAAYWVSSQAAEIFIEDSANAAVGSIGVLEVLVDMTEHLQKEGIKVTILRSTGSEDKARLNPYEPAPDEALAEEQQVLDAILSEFVGAVKAGRPKVGDVFSGKMYSTKKALKLGMVDTIGGLNEAAQRADFLARKKQRQMDITLGGTPPKGDSNSTTNSKHSMNTNDKYPRLSAALGADASIEEGPAADALETALGRAATALETEQQAHETTRKNLETANASVTELKGKVTATAADATELATLREWRASLKSEGQIVTGDAAGKKGGKVTAADERNDDRTARVAELKEQYDRFGMF